MPLFRINNKNVLFIHVPKTGGTSIEYALSLLSPMCFHSRDGKRLKSLLDGRFSRSLPLQHFHARLLEVCLDQNLIDYAFMVVRAPLARIISEYRHSRARGRLDAKMPFSQWLRFSLAAARFDPSFRNNHFRKQSDFYCFGADVFQFEAGLRNCLAPVAARLGVNENLHLPHERASEPFPVRITSKDRKLIAETYAADYERFNYEPGT
jgi:hypothetical protein